MILRTREGTLSLRRRPGVSALELTGSSASLLLPRVAMRQPPSKFQVLYGEGPHVSPSVNCGVAVVL